MFEVRGSILLVVVVSIFFTLLVLLKFCKLRKIKENEYW